MGGCGGIAYEGAPAGGAPGMAGGGCWADCRRARMFGGNPLKAAAGGDGPVADGGWGVEEDGGGTP